MSMPGRKIFLLGNPSEPGEQWYVYAKGHNSEGRLLLLLKQGNNVGFVVGLPYWFTVNAVRNQNELIPFSYHNVPYCEDSHVQRLIDNGKAAKVL